MVRSSEQNRAFALATERAVWWEGKRKGIGLIWKVRRQEWLREFVNGLETRDGGTGIIVSMLLN